MLPTYRAILRGNKLEWDDAAPHMRSDDQPIAVHVTILDEASLVQDHPSGQQMAAILEQLASKPTLSSISDPVTWQREQRSERDLPGRED
jgi:hypothetical protein